MVDKSLLDAAKSTDKEINEYLYKRRAIDDANRNAIAHLSENLNWYKIKYKDSISSKRHGLILSDIRIMFYLAEQKVISKYLSRRGFWTDFRFIIYYLIFIGIAYTGALFLLFDSLEARMMSIPPFFLLAVISCAISFYFYTESNLIKLYYTGKIKK